MIDRMEFFTDDEVSIMSYVFNKFNNAGYAVSDLYKNDKKIFLSLMNEFDEEKIIRKDN